jgi:hypothetical protein
LNSIFLHDLSLCALSNLLLSQPPMFPKLEYFLILSLLPFLIG